MKNLLLLLILTVVTASSAFAGPGKTLVNVDSKGIALQGYDPVALLTDGKAVKGDSEIRFTYQQAIYLFASQEHKTTFASDPSKYAPQFGGFCAYGVAQGKTAPIEIDAFQVVDGKLLLQYDKDIRARFNEDQAGNLNKAQNNWPKLVETKGK